MTKKECETRIHSTIDALNRLDHKLTFSFEQDEWSWRLKAENAHGHSFGAFEPMVIFDDYKRKKDAYVSFMRQVEILLAGTKLTAKGAYHNLY